MKDRANWKGKLKVLANEMAIDFTDPANIESVADQLTAKLGIIVVFYETVITNPTCDDIN